jgi:hypothetical protein
MALLFALSSTVAAEDRGLAIVAREATGKGDFDIGRQYAVIIGINQYKEWPSLKNAAPEARQVKSLLAERYYIDEFLELYDGEATAANIRRLFVETLPKKLGLHDSLLVFYAGHGQLDSSNTGFWIASDASSDAMSQSGWVPNAQLRNMIGQLKAQRVLILSDACFSGDFLNVSRGALPAVDSAYFRRALQLVSRQVLSSGASETVPDESEFGRQLTSLLERNTEPLLDPIAMYERIRLGVTKTQPLLGTLPGNENGASFVLFLRQKEGSMASSTSASPAVPPVAPPAEPATPMLKASALGASTQLASAGAQKSTVLRVSADAAGTVYVDGKMAGEIKPGMELKVDGVELGGHRVEIEYSDGNSDVINATALLAESTPVTFKTREPYVGRNEAQDLWEGQGFFAKTSMSTFSLKGIEIFADDRDVYFNLKYVSTSSNDISLFDPPNGNLFMIKAMGGVRKGEGSIVFVVSRAKIDKAAGTVTMRVNFNDSAPRQFAYFGIVKGSSGLFKMQAPPDLRKKARRS